MIGSWSNRIIDESRCHMRDRHAFDTSNRDVNYVTLRLVPVLARLSQKFCVRGGQRLMTFAAGGFWFAVSAAGRGGPPPPPPPPPPVFRAVALVAPAPP